MKDVDLNRDPGERAIIIDGVAYSGRELATYAMALAMDLTVEAAALCAAYFDLLCALESGALCPFHAEQARQVLYGRRHERSA